MTQLKYWRGPNSRRKDAHNRHTHNTTHTTHYTHNTHTQELTHNTHTHTTQHTHTTHVLLPALTRIVLLPALRRTILKSGRVLLPALGQMSDHAGTSTTEIGWTLSITDAVGHIRS